MSIAVTDVSRTAIQSQIDFHKGKAHVAYLNGKHKMVKKHNKERKALEAILNRS